MSDSIQVGLVLNSEWKKHSVHTTQQETSSASSTSMIDQLSSSVDSRSDRWPLLASKRFQQSAVNSWRCIRLTERHCNTITTQEPRLSKSQQITSDSDIMLQHYTTPTVDFFFFFFFIVNSSLERSCVDNCMPSISINCLPPSRGKTETRKPS